MKRLVYTPRVYAFVKDSNGEIRDVSRYIVSGQVHRVLMQVSDAQLTLRNPKMLFTKPDGNGRVAFAPMDPITIYLKRVTGRPVRVFTGFLDRTPYITLYPGTISLRASCTLKRLLYTFFDPALPYTESFLATYGWINRGDGTIYSPSAWREQPTATITGNGLVVGDSLGVGTSTTLTKLVGQAHLKVNAEVGRNSTDGANIAISALKGDKYDYLIFDLGTNDADAATLQSNIQRVQNANNGLPIFVLTVPSGAPNATAKNAMLQSLPGVTVIDWNSVAVTGSDNIHSTPSGYSKRAKLIFNTLKASTGQNDAAPANSNSSNLTEGSFSNLLFETLKQIGHWDPDRILIEKLPSDIFSRMAELYVQITEDQADLKKVVDGLFRKVVGEGDYGNSPASPVNLGKIDGTVPEVVYKVGMKMNAPDKLMLSAFCTGLTEAPIDNGHSFGNPSYGDGTSVGWRQETSSAYPGVDRMNVQESAQRYFTEGLNIMAGKADGKAGMGHYMDSWTAGNLSQAIQGSAYGERYDTHRAVAQTLLRKIATRVAKEGSTDLNVPNIGGFPEGGTSNTTTKQSTRNKKKSTGSTTLYSPIKGLSVDTIGVGGGAYGASRSYGGHAGVDMGCPWGTTLYSITDGVVVYAGSWGSEGQLCVIRSTQKVDNYPDNIRIGYGHMSSISVSKGDQVSAGDPIGKSGHGSNGQNHLHLFVRQDDTPSNGTMDPTPLAKAAAKGQQPSGGPGSSAGNSPTSTSDPTNVTQFGGAGAFASTMEFPTLMESMEAVALTGQKSLMNDKPLMPFVQQLCEASLREFQSMPDGSFFAFYPDYFGEMYHRPPYWEIDDIEILDGNVEVSDDALTTHYYVVGDTSGTGNEQLNSLMSAGVITVFNAFMASGLLTQDQKKAGANKKGKEKGPTDLLLSADEAIDFLNRYGARPQVDDVPMIRHPYFEMFLAYQRFMLAWSKQFSTPFTFTFMPELYPGGKVGFPDHDLQMYIEEVTHTFDYESGFTTVATLSAPSVYAGNGAVDVGSELPPRMVRAIIEPALPQGSSSNGD